MPKPPTSNKSIRLPDDKWREIEALAKIRGLRVNAAVAEALELWLYPPSYLVSAAAPAELRQMIQPLLRENNIPTSRIAHQSATKTAPRVDIQIGPTRRAPGSMLKGTKK